MLQEKELQYYWMPFTENRGFKRSPRQVCRAKGMYFESLDGKSIIDASSALFTCPAGHSRSEIADAVSKQLRELAYTPTFQMAHPGVFELAERVAELTPEGMERIFFCNSGSEAVDSAIKMAHAYFMATGEGQRQRLVSRDKAYHGVNMGGVSLSGMVKNRVSFGLGLPGVVHMRHTWLEENRYVRGQGETGAFLADDLQRFAEIYGGETIAACFVEPIAGSYGCLVPPRGYLQRLREICDQHGILLVFDEVICGFGRTGDKFAANSFGVKPDMILMAKALTNGAQPMGAVAVRNEIYDTVVEAANPGAIELFHGYTYSGHPAACAAGIAALEIYKKEALFERANQLAPYFLDGLYSLKDEEEIVDIRGYGMLGAIEFKAGAVKGARGGAIQRTFFENGMHVKLTGDTAIFAPAFVAEKEDIDTLFEITREVVRHKL